jgi:hypothetical protein
MNMFVIVGNEINIMSQLLVLFVLFRMMLDIKGPNAMPSRFIGVWR